MPTGLVEIIKKDNIKFKGYVTAPADGVYPGVLLLHQEYGIDPSIRVIAELLAAKNYTVFVPDLFWRNMPGCELSSKKESDIIVSKQLLSSYNIDEGLNDVTSCLKWLRETPQCNGLVSTIGFGLGANLSYLAGLWLDIESSVCYDFYKDSFFQENDTFIRRPMLVHLNKNCYKSLQDNKKSIFIEDTNNIDLKLYEKCNTNFYRISDVNYNEEYTKKAEDLTLSHINTSFKKPHNT